MTFLNIALGLLAAIRTFPGLVTTGTVVTAAAVQTGGHMPQTAADWIVLTCGALGAAVSYVQISIAKGKKDE